MSSVFVHILARQCRQPHCARAHAHSQDCLSLSPITGHPFPININAPRPRARIKALDILSKRDDALGKWIHCARRDYGRGDSRFDCAHSPPVCGYAPVVCSLCMLRVNVCKSWRGACQSVFLGDDDDTMRGYGRSRAARKVRRY